MSSDRAAVAREVLTEYADILRDAGQTLSEAEVRRYVREHYPAPPAPETVTVDDGVFRTVWTDVLNGVRWEAKGDGLRAAQVAVFGHAAALRRIASDARVIQERDARIAELEKEVERVRELGVTMKLAADRHFATATENYKRAEEARTERDAALRALEAYQNGIGPMGSKGEGLGETLPKSEAQTGDDGQAGPGASPAPIPLGAVIGDYEWNGAQWERRGLYNTDGERLRLSVGSDLHEAVTGWYRAKHPVATRETVERVALAVRDADLSRSYLVPMHVYHKLARAALTAAGFTLEAGA